MIKKGFLKYLLLLIFLGFCLTQAYADEKSNLQDKKVQPKSKSSKQDKTTEINKKKVIPKAKEIENKQVKPKTKAIKPAAASAVKKSNLLKTVQKDDIIKVEYIGKLEDGTIISQSEKATPMEFTVGSKKMIIGFDKAVIGMKLNEKKTVTIQPAEGFGVKRKNLQREVARDVFPPNFIPKPGKRIVLKNPNGKRFQCTIISSNKSIVKVDFNHPFAGKVLIFTIKIISINKPQEKQ